MFRLYHPDHKHSHGIGTERLLRLWRAHKAPKSPWYPRSNFHCEGLVKSGGVEKMYMATRVTEFEPDQYTSPRVFVEDLIAAAQDVPKHFCRLDELYARLVDCVFINRHDDVLDSGYDDGIVRAASSLLSRLPSIPVEFSLNQLVTTARQADLDKGYFSDAQSPETEEDTAGKSDLEKTWSTLVVASRISANIIRLALILGQTSRDAPSLRNLRRLGDTTALLLEEAIEAQRSGLAAGRDDACFVVQAFLWSSWQRFTMLYLWQALRLQLEGGYDYHQNEYVAIQGTRLSKQVYETNMNLGIANSNTSGMAPYMCNWALRQILSERSSATLDFRRFNACFNSVFGAQPARCKAGNKPCNGRSPENCQRFVGSAVMNQSMHDPFHCLGVGSCARLCWDEDSYRAVSGTRAVCIETTRSSSKLKYRAASARTLAISHVWAHGQGGRPETHIKSDDKPGGMNACLHQRYARIARQVGCDSYWMDTPCIPEDKELRAVAIRGINGVFSGSKITLVCDKDIMTLDVPAALAGQRDDNDPDEPSEADIIFCERVLVTLLVCDWNMRAWTLLEAMKGRNNIHVLCRGNAIVSLKRTLDIACHHGTIDIAILCLTAQHFLPVRLPDNALGDRNLIKRGLVGLEEAASLLSHRHASRDGDDIIIWSLLFNEKAFVSAQELWLAEDCPHKYSINSGFLVSSAPRIQDVPGLSWAPSRPAIRLSPEEEAKGYRAHMATAPYNTSMCDITPEGLHGGWYIHKFNCGGHDAPPAGGQLHQITQMYLRGCSAGALLRPVSLNVHQETTPSPFQGDASGPLLAVCGAPDDSSPWQWKAVFEWNTQEPLPDFHREMLLIA